MIDLRERLEEIAPTPTQPVRVEAVRRRAVQLRRRRRGVAGAVVAAMVLVAVVGAVRFPDRRAPMAMGEWQAQLGPLGVTLRATPAVVRAGDPVTFDVHVHDDHGALDQVVLDLGNGTTRRLTDACGAGASDGGIDWSTTAAASYDEPGAYLVSVQVSTFEDCEHGVVAESIYASGLVVIQPPVGTDPVVFRLTAPFGPAGAETGLGIELADTDGGAVRSVTIDWGDGVVRTWEPPCDMQLVAPQGSRWKVRPPHGYDQAGQFTVHISVTTGTACGVSAPDQTVTGEATATVLPRSGG